MTFDSDTNKEENLQPKPQTTENNSQSQSNKLINTLRIGGGISNPSSPDDFSKYWNMGYNIVFGFNFGISSIVGIGTEINYGSFGLNGDKLFENAGLSGYNLNISGGNVSVLLVLIDLKINMTREAIRPYLIGGLGYYKQEFSAATLSIPGVGSQSINSNTENGFTFGVGIGIDIDVSPKVALFFEGKLQSNVGEQENTNYIPIRAGIDLSLSKD